MCIQLDSIDIAHDQAEDNNLLKGESITAEHIDLSIQHVNLDQAVETDIIHSESYYIDRVTDPLNQFCIFFNKLKHFSLTVKLKQISPFNLLTWLINMVKWLS